ncbi:MAG: hypothetical protein JEY99_15045 [Spirochaetales bacterium]|nr:hypothetical protein [Spirochaetales bacterium]
MEKSIPGYIDYAKREFCKAIKCPVQNCLDKEEPGSAGHDDIRKICKEGCMHSTHEFHSWLINAGYLVVRPE